MTEKQRRLIAHYHTLVRQARHLEGAQSVLDRMKPTFTEEEWQKLQTELDQLRFEAELEIIVVAHNLSNL